MIIKPQNQLLLPPPSHLALRHMWFRLNGAYSFIKNHLTLKRVATGAGIICAASAILYAGMFFWPRATNFSYASSTCVTSPTLFPRLHSSNSSAYTATTPARFSIAGYPIYSHKICLTPLAAPKANTSSAVTVQLGIFKKTLRVHTGSFPSIVSNNLVNKPVSTQDPISFKLNSADTFFAYNLAANNLSVGCNTSHDFVMCDTTKLELTQSVDYAFTLTRMHKDEPVEVLLETTATTVESVRIVSSSIQANQTVYDTPTTLTLSLNRPVSQMTGAKLMLVSGDTTKEIEITSSVKDATVTVTFTTPLARSASFIFSVEGLTAADGGYLPAPFSLPFATSGGPKVTHLNIASYKVAQNASIVLTFDSNISKSQNLNDYVTFEVAGTKATASLTLKENTLTIKPAATMPRCTSIAIKISEGLANVSGITGGTSWRYTSRTICQTSFSIGTSVQGRAIQAYSFGTGASKIVYIGTTHGNEKSSTYLLNKWVDTLEANYDRIPANRTIVVIPNINPDGYAKNQRTNANNVDLNRNFPSNDWKSGVTMPDGSYLPNGGGATALSEPESQAVATYISSQKPRLVLTYHASGSIVSPNDSGDSSAIATTYAQKSIVGFLSNAGTGEFFDYDTTGAFEAWLHDALDIPALLIELRTKTGDDFSGHQSALWYTAQLP